MSMSNLNVLEKNRAIWGKTKFQAITLKKLDRSQALLLKIKQRDWRLHNSAGMYYFLAWVIFSLYAGKACPFIDQNFIFSFLDNLLLQVALSVFISIVPLYLLRVVCASMIGKERLLAMNNMSYILFESFFLAVWIGVMYYISIAISLSLESTLKIVIGPFILSFFSVINMTLIRQRDKYSWGVDEARSKITRFVSIRSKLIFVSIIVLLLMGTVVALTALKNFWWLIHNFETIMLDQAEGVASVIKEVMFIIAVFVGYLVITVINYTININIIFVMLNNTIYKLFSKEYDYIIPPINDEFGIMGENIEMISSELQIKEKMSNVFGKIVSPKIAEILLEGGDTLDTAGKERELVVLFSDIRGFTEFTHQHSAHSVVAELNKYFTAMVNILEKRDGIVDKFIGDALMGLFGYDDVAKGVNDAVYAACYMQNYLEQTDCPFQIGIGVGVGQAILGSVGAASRLDYTVIGDVVNTSSRLEASTKQTEVDIMISHEVYRDLNAELRDLPWKRFSLDVKGIAESIEAYGLAWDEAKHTSKL